MRVRKPETLGAVVKEKESALARYRAPKDFVIITDSTNWRHRGRTADSGPFVLA